MEAACRDHQKSSGASWVQLETIWRQLETIWGQLEARRRPLEAIWEPKWQIIPLFTTNRHIDLQMCSFLHAFVHLVPPNLTFIPLFTYQSPLFKNVRKHQFLHAFVRWLKTSLFTRLWSRNIMGWTQPPPKEGETKIILRENIIFETELPPNLIFYMLLDTSPTSSRNIFYRVW